MKATHISLFTISFALLFLASGVVGQISPKEHAQAQVIKWSTRVDYLTKEIVSESSAVSDSERSMYLALLAKILWEVDQKEARVHLKKAADKMLSGLSTDDKSDLAKRVRLSQRTIEIITKLDEKLAQELIVQLVAAVDEDAEDGNRKENPELAELYVKLGLQVVEKKPELALACGFDSLVYGVSSRLPGLISELNIKDSAKADMLYRQAMAKVQGNYSPSVLLFESNLVRYIFDVYGPKGFSESFRRGFLSTYADRVAAATLVEPERPVRCRIANYAPVAISWINEYLPDRTVTFSQNIQTCTPYISGMFQELARAQTSADQPKTADEFVRAAIDAHDNILKLRYWREALSHLEKEKKYAEIISVLDSTDGDDLKAFAPVVWDDWRIDAAYQTALVSFEAKDLPAVYRVIERTPKRIRPEVRMRVIKKLTPSANNQFYMENLDEMQKELGSSEQTDKDVAGYYKKLAELYLKVRPTESEAMFRNAVKYINKTDDDNPDFLNDKDWAPFSDYVPMTCELLDVDEQSITSSFNNISSRRSRVRLKLGLLESSLKKLGEAKKVLDELNKQKKPGTDVSKKIVKLPAKP